MNKKRGLRVHVATAYFVPKPHTPFQWEKQITPQEYLRRCRENAAHVVARCGWTRIDCARAGAPRLIDDIHNEVMTCVADLIG